MTLESTAQDFASLTMFSLVLMVTAGITSIMILLDFDWGVRVMNIICLVIFMFLMGVAIPTHFYPNS